MKIRKFTSLLLTTLILISNMGLAFDVHYCKGEIASISTIFNNANACEMPVAVVEKKCCKSKTVIHESCCKNKSVEFSKQDNTVFKTISFSIDFNSIVASTFIVRSQNKIATQNSATIQHYSQANSPPFYKLYNQYIFYA